MNLSVKVVLIILFPVTIVFQSGIDILACESIPEENIEENIRYTDTLSIVAFGNSITATRKTIDKVYAQRLPVLLHKNGIEAKVINSGIPGSHTGHVTDNNLFKIKHALDRFESDVLAYNPDIVIIGFGTNDAHIDSKKIKGKSRIPLDKYEDNLEYMIKQLLDRDAQIILIAPNMLGEKYAQFQNKRLLKYIRVVRHFADKYKLGLVDNYKLFVNYQKKTGKSYEELMLDGVHPNDLGHKLIVDELTKEIIRIVKIDNYEKK